MPVSTIPEWQHLAAYAVGAALLLILLFRLPVVGPLLRGLTSFALFAFCLFLLLQQAPFNPTLARLTDSLGLDTQQVSGNAVRIPMGRAGQFWADVRLNGVERRMLVDSGATVTAISAETARRAGIAHGGGLLPIIMQTANGAVKAETGTVETLTLGSIRARNLKVVISPALGPLDVLGMNFLSELAAWRVEGRTLILVPKPPTPRSEAET